MAALRSPMLSPVSTATGSFIPTTPMELISPSTRRSVSVMNRSVTSTTTTASSTMMLRTEKDDETERRERRRSRLLEIQRRNLSSPATPTDRRRSMPLTGLSNAQLTDHYTSCIKLSAENKINAKNAFGLHLIDYLSELMKKKDMNNFQVASSTLDASAKIYAGRVDAIHTETYKVLTGLGRGGERQDIDGSGGGDGPDEDHDVDGKDGGKNKRKRARRDQTIETNLKNINVNKFDLEFEVDPLFQKTSATFDEGGAGGLLLNHLYCIDDSSAVILDSNTVVTGAQDHPTNDEESSQVDLTELRGLYSRVNLEPLQICPEFSEFSFTNWNVDEETAFNMSRTAVECERRFDLNAEVQPFSMTMPHPHYDDDDNRADDLPLDDFTGREDDPSDTKANTSGNSNFTVTDGKETQLVESIMTDMKHGTIGSLIEVLAAEPTEYSYFNTNILRSWAGPEHWKLKPKTKEDQVSEKTDDDATKKKRRKKEPLKIEFSEEFDTRDKTFLETRASTTLTKTTLIKYQKSKTLPEDLHYDTDNLFKLFAKPKVMVRRQENSEDLEDGIGNYDYNNDNDKENFVPDVQGDDDDDDDAMGGTIDFNFSAGDGFSQSQELPSSQEDGMNTTVFTGDNLVAQPDKIAKLNIGYAKTAKKVDVKRLKASMWNLLMKPEPKKKEPKLNENEDAENTEGDAMEEEESVETSKANSVAGEHTFQCLMADLPNCLSKNMTKNLSVPIAFVCLLHLANEKALKIWSDESMDDLHITQG